MAGMTENYGLMIWGREDEFQSPEELNGNFAALDGAVAGLVVTGSYAGNGEASRAIELGFAPRAVLLENKWGIRASQTGYGFGGLAVAGGGLNDTTVVLGDTGFIALYDGNKQYANKSGYTYYFIAIR